MSEATLSEEDVKAVLLQFDTKQSQIRATVPEGEGCRGCATLYDMASRLLRAKAVERGMKISVHPEEVRPGGTKT